MPIRRTIKKNQKKWLNSNKELKILDLGCSNANFWPEANHFADIHDYREDFKIKNLKFTKIEPDKKLPFKDKEFDYIICAHVIEHVNDPIFFKQEIERIGKSGYIELPTRLNDNIVFGCDEEIYGHKWWFEFDDDDKKLVFAEKRDAIEQFVSVGSIFNLTDIFEDSFIIQTYWNDSIEMEVKEPYEIEKKISFLSLVKKYFSKKIRIQLSKIKNLIRL
jgi:SAM-dependent methyltransferase